MQTANGVERRIRRRKYPLNIDMCVQAARVARPVLRRYGIVPVDALVTMSWGVLHLGRYRSAGPMTHSKKYPQSDDLNRLTVEYADALVRAGLLTRAGPKTLCMLRGHLSELLNAVGVVPPDCNAIVAHKIKWDKVRAAMSAAR
jgi:hypothetical protein